MASGIFLTARCFACYDKLIDENQLKFCSVGCKVLIVQVLIEDLILKPDINPNCQEFLAIVPDNKLIELHNVLLNELNSLNLLGR